MRCAACTGDDHFQSPAFSLGRILRKPQRRAMSGDDPAFMRHFKLRQQLVCVCRKVSQSDLLPIMTPTNGLESFFMAVVS